MDRDISTEERETDLYPTVPGDRPRPLPHPRDKPLQPMIGEKNPITEAAKLDPGLASLLMSTSYDCWPL